VIWENPASPVSTIHTLGETEGFISRLQLLWVRSESGEGSSWDVRSGPTCGSYRDVHLKIVRTVLEHGRQIMHNSSVGIFQRSAIGLKTLGLKNCEVFDVVTFWSD